MTRNLDLIRKLLLYFEQKEDVEKTDAVADVIENIGYDFNTADSNMIREIEYQLILLYESKLITGDTRCFPNSEEVHTINPRRLTWEGHDFLDSIKDETRFKKVERTFQEEVKGWSIELIKAYTSQLIKSQLGLDTR